jgi:hypothetical protein
VKPIDPGGILPVRTSAAPSIRHMQGMTGKLPICSERAMI